jgi:hypothetical protein
VAVSNYSLERWTANAHNPKMGLDRRNLIAFILAAIAAGLFLVTLEGSRSASTNLALRLLAIALILGAAIYALFSRRGSHRKS